MARVARVQPMPSNYYGGTNVVPPGSGLDQLASLDEIFIQQRKEWLEIFTSWESNKKYVLKNSMGQQCFYAFEEATCCQRQWCRGAREFQLHIVDNNGNELLRLFRPFICQPCGTCCDMGQQQLFVEGPPGIAIGSIQQQTFCCSPKFKIYDHNNFSRFEIFGKCWQCDCSDRNFLVGNFEDGQIMATITKQWAGCLTETWTDADKYVIRCKSIKLMYFFLFVLFHLSFINDVVPINLDVRLKALLLGCLFLIDFMFFEFEK